MRYTRLYADEAGESRFEDVDIPLASLDFSPPAPPVNLSAMMPSTGCAFLVAPVGWYGDRHPSPRQQFMVYLAGEMKVESSDGEVRHFGPGDVLLVEDTTGKGHRSWVLGDADAHIVVVQLPR